MLKRRIIPCLDIKNGRTVKGTNFVNLRDAGDPVELASRYAKEGADGLVFLDISATIDQRKTTVQLARQVAATIDIPFTVGGGIDSVEDAFQLLDAGADKVAINSAAVHSPDLIAAMAAAFGSQCIVVAIDTNRSADGLWKVYTHGGRSESKYEAIDWAQHCEQAGAGELLLTSMRADGTKKGFDLSITRQITSAVALPVIASGGAGSAEDFVDVFKDTRATGALAASIFHYNQVLISDTKLLLGQSSIPVRP